MEPMELRIKEIIREISNTVDELFSLLYWNDDNVNMYDADVENLRMKIEDILNFLGEWKCEQKIRKLVDEMLRSTRDLLPKIAYKIDEELTALAHCLLTEYSDIPESNTEKATASDGCYDDAKVAAKTDDATSVTIDTFWKTASINANKIDTLEKIDLNKIDVSKIKNL
jgi:hypothetical protein